MKEVEEQGKQDKNNTIHISKVFKPPTMQPWTFCFTLRLALLAQLHTPRFVQCSFIPIPVKVHQKQQLALASFSTSPQCELDDHVHNGLLYDVIDENIKLHMEEVQQSENLFYGYYSPDGITEWDIANAPSAWTYYSLSPSQDSYSSSKYETVLQGREGGMLQRFSTTWEYLMEMDRRIIPPPFSNDDLARVSMQPILTAQECQEIIEECENHYWGWGNSVERYGTPSERVGHMLKLEDLSQSYTLVNFVLLPRLFPAIVNAFPSISLKPGNLRLGGCRVVKYDASEGRVELGMHRDGLLVTANIALNSLDEYVGGGTIVEGANERNEPIRIDRGHVLLHPGDVMHGGSPITHGIRYVLVLFILSTDIVPHEKYCQDRMEREMEKARAITIDDATRASERERLFASAMKHGADAHAFSHQPPEETIWIRRCIV
jgi:predicted 2-oxoglutarate/Fe(II)-dependent dioxygenase YbiX